MLCSRQLTLVASNYTDFQAIYLLYALLYSLNSSFSSAFESMNCGSSLQASMSSMYFSTYEGSPLSASFYIIEFSCTAVRNSYSAQSMLVLSLSLGQCFSFSFISLSAIHCSYARVSLLIFSYYLRNSTIACSFSALSTASYAYQAHRCTKASSTSVVLKQVVLSDPLDSSNSVGLGATIS